MMKQRIHTSLHTVLLWLVVIEDIRLFTYFQGVLSYFSTT